VARKRASPSASRRDACLSEEEKWEEKGWEASSLGLKELAKKQFQRRDRARVKLKANLQPQEKAGSKKLRRRSGGRRLWPRAAVVQRRKKKERKAQQKAHAAGVQGRGPKRKEMKKEKTKKKRRTGRCERAVAEATSAADRVHCTVLHALAENALWHRLKESLARSFARSLKQVPSF
jgi:hypothetical protein